MENNLTTLWKQKMSNLMRRRKEKSLKRNSITGNYKLNLSKLHIGNSVLDVGCGGMDIGKELATRTPPPSYTGLDPFPLSADVVNGKIEDYNVPDKMYDTVLAFAVLDGVEDIDKALANMNRIAAKNIGILTGIDIEIDNCHTFKITEAMLVAGFKDFNIHLKEELCPRVFLYDFWRKE
jgi:ubiquinone/menaquinone biosynthesis C-methylase UbiE